MQQVYEVRLVPDLVYGLGMRLEKRDNDIVLASFKKHPTEGMLPGMDNNLNSLLARSLPTKNLYSIPF